jgi:hypothetical protein
LLIDNMDHVLVKHNHLYMDMVELMVLLMVVDLVDMMLVVFEFLFDQTLVQQVYDVLVVI